MYNIVPYLIMLNAWLNSITRYVAHSTLYMRWRARPSESDSIRMRIAIRIRDILTTYVVRSRISLLSIHTPESRLHHLSTTRYVIYYDL